jgi:hypothetical protein
MARRLNARAVATVTGARSWWRHRFDGAAFDADRDRCRARFRARACSPGWSRRATFPPRSRRRQRLLRRIGGGRLRFQHGTASGGDHLRHRRSHTSARSRCFRAALDLNRNAPLAVPWRLRQMLAELAGEFERPRVTGVPARVSMTRLAPRWRELHPRSSVVRSGRGAEGSERATPRVVVVAQDGCCWRMNRSPERDRPPGG